MESSKKGTVKVAIVIVIVGLSIIVGIFLAVRFFAKKLPRPILPSSVPTISLEEGGGIDEKSEVFKQSVNEIEKLKQYLPYEETLILSTDIEVSITISKSILNIHPWMLTIDVYGINYQADPQVEPDEYALMRDSFREAASYVFSWMKSHGVSPEKVVVSWGSRAFIQESAEEWLKEK